MLVDYDIFIHGPKLDRNDVANVSDHHTGQAPDRGALEVGEAAPHDGPRP